MTGDSRSRIHVLEKIVAERIAAGEVVDRPASVVKELIENSLDAGATRIVTDVEGAGSTLVRVSDDGAGIDPDDLPLAVERFATSKVRTADDLLALHTLGFRGEALPSIAAVSHFEIISAADEGHGRRLRANGSGGRATVTLGAPRGTTVAVRQLFFNTPARRKFLKSAGREFALITDVVNRAALAYPDTAFRLTHEGRDVLRYAPGTLADRVAGVLGAEAFGACIFVEHAAAGTDLTGWLGRPELARATRRQQFLFVNRRPVSSRVVAGAVDQAYQQLVPHGRYPLFVLFLDLPPDRVDINIHPRKTEVRFDDDHRVFSLVARTVREALLGTQLVRTVDDVGVAVPVGTPTGLMLGAGEMAVREDRPVTIEGGRLPAMRLLGQVHGTYLLAQGSDGLIVIDQHAAHERVLYERLLAQRSSGAPVGQLLVTPVPVELDAAEESLLAVQQETLARLGFVVEEFGDRTVLLRSTPQVAHRAPAGLFKDLLAELADADSPHAARGLLERLTITTACHSAIRAGDALTVEQMGALIHDLSRTEDPYTCFHGRPTLVTVPLAQLDRWFLRR